MSLRNRLLLSYALVIALAVGVTFVALLVLLRDTPERQRQVTLASRAEDLAEFGRLLPLNDAAPERLRDRLVRFSVERRTRALVTNDAGIVQTDSISQTRAVMTGQTLSFSRKIQDTDGVVGDFRDPTGRRYIFGAVPSRQQGTWFVLALPAAERQFALSLVDELMQSLIRAFLFALVPATLLAIVIARSLSRPIQHVAAAARAMASHVPSPPIAAQGPAEVRQLARDFNEMSARVQTAQQTEREFIANVSHELRTPLTSIQGFAQAIRDGAATDTEHAATVIVDESARLQRMVNELLDSARIESGATPMARNPVDINALAQAVVQRLQTQADTAQIALSLVTGALPGPLTGDGDRLFQVLTNLVDNALKHTPAGGKVRLETSHSAKGIEIAVVDSGHGIADVDLPRVFDRFYQTDKSRSSGHGAGLGLAIARQIVEAHGGTIAVQSVLGIGTRFTVRLPHAVPRGV